MKKLDNLGERGIIQLLQSYIDASDLLGTNEDAYLFDTNLPHILINVDTMSRNSDFLPGQTWAQIGAKLVSISFSDLAAKGALPTIFLSSMVLENSMIEKELRELVDSFQKTANNYDAKYLGGDLGSAMETVLTGVGLGSITKGKILSRREAKLGDLVCVTGFFGLTTIGLNHLLSPSDKRFDSIPDSLIEQSIELLYEPTPKITEGMLLSQNEIANASIDSSDGLAISLHWLSQASKIGFLLNTLPIHPEIEPYLESPQDSLEVTMFGGEEYELVFTVPPHRVKELESVFSKYNKKFIIIGKCISPEGVFISQEGNKISLPMEGWDSFRKKVY